MTSLYTTAHYTTYGVHSDHVTLMCLQPITTLCAGNFSRALTVYHQADGTRLRKIGQAIDAFGSHLLLKHFSLVSLRKYSVIRLRAF